VANVAAHDRRARKVYAEPREHPGGGVETDDAMAGG
jgi:hypothetical protein